MVILIFLAINLYLPANSPAAQKTGTSYDTTFKYNLILTPLPVTPTTDNTFGVTKTLLGVTPIPPPAPPPFIPPPTDPTVPAEPLPTPITTPAIDPSTAPITLDPVSQAIVLGSGATGTDGSGALWYSGSSPAGTCNPCTAGVCTFGVGFRAYFEVKFTTSDSSTNSTAQGDGFSFIIMNAANNDVTKRGGSPSTAVSMGELIGHAGPGNTALTSSLPQATPPLDGLGLEPPKMSLEFDTYPNTTALTYNGCTGGRADSANNHLSLMFWGLNPDSTTMCNAASTAGSTYPQASFDDNVHGVGTAGSTTVPRNSITGDGTGGYYERAKGASTYNWLEDDQYHRVRIELIRTSSAQTYQVKAWVDCETLASPYTACPANEYIYFQDIYNPYTNSSYLPKIDRTVTLSTDLNAQLNNILFGFTEGTGAATQKIQITNVATYFPTIAISPTSRSHTHISATGQTVSVAAASSSCPWTAVSNTSSPAWITVTAGATGTGPGTVTYSVAANTGTARTGTITISGQIFTVTQAAAPPTCSLTASTNIIPYNSTATLNWTMAGGPATTASFSPTSGTCTNSVSLTGGTCTTAAQTAAGAQTYTLTVSNASGSNTCSRTVYVGCQNYRVWNNLGNTYDFSVGTQCGNNVDSTKEITTSNSTRRLDPGETIQQRNSAGTCTGALIGNSLDYNDAMNKDISVNGGNGDCRVNFTGNHTATDR